MRLFATSCEFGQRNEAILPLYNLADWIPGEASASGTDDQRKGTDTKPSEECLTDKEKEAH